MILINIDAYRWVLMTMIWFLCFFLMFKKFSKYKVGKGAAWG